MLTYRGLCERRATWHRAIHVAGPLRVATLFENGPDTAVALLSLLDQVRLCPLNLEAQSARLSDSITEAQIDVVLYSSALSVTTLAHLQKEHPGKLVPVDLQNARLLGELPKGGRNQAGLTLFTSGSTGTPKRVPLTPDQLALSATNICNHLRLGPADRAVHALPMFHVGALVDLLLAPLSAGGTVIIAANLESTSLVSAVRTHAATWLQLVPTALHRLMADLDDATAQEIGQRLRFLRMVSADLTLELRAQATSRLGPVPIIQMYGMTETAGQITSMSLDETLHNPSAVGRAAGPEVAIIDNFRNRLPAGHEGEVCVSGPTIMTGYEGTDITPRYGDWFRTGDLGVLDEDGVLTLTGRLKEQINRGGEKISPLVVERAAKSVPGVLDAVAYGVPHPTLGEQVALAVVTDQPLEEATLLEALQSQLSAFEVPRRVLFLDALPQLSSGKTDRRSLASMPDQSETAHSPTDPLTTKVATIWATHLQCRTPHAQSDFFDDGGDSLAATEFIALLEDALGRSVDPNILFEAPRLEALVAALRADQPKTQSEPAHLQYLRKRIAGWQGQRVGPHGLIILRNSLAQGTPAFFCANGMAMPRPLSNHIFKDHPFHIMRSLFGFGGKDTALNAELAKLYARDIASLLTPAEPVILGGFCEGVRVMEMVGQDLTKLGHPISMFLAIDNMFDVSTPYPVYYVWSNSPNYSGAVRYRDPSLGFAVLHPKGAVFQAFDRAHVHLLDRETLPKLRKAVTPYLAGKPLPRQTPSDQISLPERKARHDARIALHAPRFLSRSKAKRVTVTVTNTSKVPWPPTADSGLFLSIDFDVNGLDTTILRHAIADFATAIAPGETQRFGFDLTWPSARRRPYRLTARIVDDGMARFGSDTGSGNGRLVFRIP